jgi:hypothetical protein
LLTESHGEHAISLIEHKVRAAVQRAGLLSQVLQETTLRGANSVKCMTTLGLRQQGLKQL